jgi:hypothetical protein
MTHLWISPKVGIYLGIGLLSLPLAPIGALAAAPETRAVDQTVTCDVLVVGGGLSGAS